MAVYRPTPKCPYCGESTHEAKYKELTQLQKDMAWCGDTFEGWNDLEHECKGSIEELNKLNKSNGNT